MAQGDGAFVCEVIESLCTVGKDGFGAAAYSPLILRDWQKELIGHLYARREDNRRKFRVALIGLPRKNGKSALGSAIALERLLFGGVGVEVYSAAAEKEQARIVFGETKRMVTANEELAEKCVVMRDIIQYPETNSIYRVLSSEAFTKEGLNISAAIVDELHAHPNRELWDVLNLGTGARLDPLVVAITTAGVVYDSRGDETVCYDLYKHGIDVSEGRVEDPSFFFAWWGAPQGADFKDPEVWADANPMLGDLIDPESVEGDIIRTPENEFRTKRLNQWVSSSNAWFPQGVWERQGIKNKAIEDGTEIVIGFDGSYSQDTTALVACTMEREPFLQVVGLWERPLSAPDDWTVPIGEVENKIRELCYRFKVKEISCDPSRWARTIEALESERLPIAAFPQSPERMVPATARFYEAVMNGSLTHDGSPKLNSHVSAAVLRDTLKGPMISKQSKTSSRKIDLAVAAILAYTRAQQLGPSGPAPRIVDLSQF